MDVKIYANVHRTKKNNEKYRVTYTIDGTTFKHTDSFGEIPAGPGDKLFMDTLPVQHTDGGIELVRRGVEVYCLRRLTLIEKVRREHKLPKTTRGDIRGLMSIEEEWFRRVTGDFLVMRRMILAHRSLLKTHQQLVNKAKALSESERVLLKPAISFIEKQMEEMAKKIDEEIVRRYPDYGRLVDELGIRGNIKAQVALAELIPYLDQPMGLRKMANLLGLFRPVRGGKKIHSGHLRRALQGLAASANNTTVFQLTARMEKEVLSRIWTTYRMEARGRLAMPAQG